MAKMVLFGTGKIAQVVHHHLVHDSPHEVAGFTVDAAFMPPAEDGRHRFLGKPVVAFEEVERCFPPDAFAMFVAVGYHDLNAMRARAFAAAKAKGYSLPSYVRSGTLGPLEIGDNCFVMDHNALQPCARLGDNCFVWNHAVVGHHASIGDHCWLTSGAKVGGSARIGDHAFLGLGATVGHEVTLGPRCFLGAGALVTRDAEAESVFIAPATEKFRLNSGQFLRMSKLR